jgi:hypothetical protein
MDKRIFYVEWRYAFETEIQRHIYRDITWKQLLTFTSVSNKDLIYFYFEDITDQSIEDFEERLNPYDM